MASNHVLLFRKCLEATANLVNPGYNFNGGHVPISALTSAAAPKYGVPEGWCTEKSLEAIRNTGKRLISRLVGSRGRRRVFVRFVSDSLPSSVDTALSLSLGAKDFAQEAGEQVVVLSGAESLQYDAPVFRPHVKGLCTLSRVERNELKTSVAARAENTPRPSTSLREALETLEQLANDDPDRLSSFLPTEELQVVVDERTNRLMGPVNVVRLWAKAMFATRVAGVEPFLPDATVDDVYRALEWSDWVDTVEEGRNPHNKAEAALLAHMVRNDLTYRPADGADDDDVVRLTVLVVDDSDLAALASFADLRWELDAPYVGGNFPGHASPPGSALHFERDATTGRVGLQFLYPVPLAEVGAETYPYYDEARNYAVDYTGIPRATRVDVAGGTLDGAVTDPEWTRVPTIDFWENKLHDMIKDSPSARLCVFNYAAMEDKRKEWWTMTRPKDSNNDNDKNVNDNDKDLTAPYNANNEGDAGVPYRGRTLRETGLVLIVTVVIIVISVAMVQFFVVCDRRRTRRKNTRAQRTSAPTTDDDADARATSGDDANANPDARVV